MSENKGVITSNDLMKKLVQAKKVMQKVDSDTYERGNIDQNIIRSAPEEITESNINKKNVRQNISVEKIQQSKLPENIKKAMIENPIPQITLNDTLDMNFIKGAKKLMEQEGLSTTKNTKSAGAVNTNEIISQITPIIENTIRKVLDEKLNQLLTAYQTTSINENLVLKVGDSVFKGKITGVNKTK